MKSKILYGLIFLFTILTLNVNAQTADKKKITSVLRNCYAALTHDNVGVVESAIFISMQFKNKFPNENASKLLDAIEEIAEDGESPTLTYKAQLAKIYINNRALFDDIVINSIQDESKVYSQISEKLNTIMLATSL